jgi:hypothetical protein
MSPSTPARRPWTANERKKLDELLTAKTADEIATALQRTPPSIYSRLQLLYRKRPRPSDASSGLGLKVKK